MATNSEFAKIWLSLTLAYPGFGKDGDANALAQTMRLYSNLLADIPGDVLQMAAEQYVASSRFFPTIAELREACGALMAPQFLSGMEAWSEVLHAMSGWNRYSANGILTPQFSNLLITRVVKSMGWLYICDSEDQMADRAHFIRAYDDLVKREQAELMLLPATRAMRAELAAGREATALTPGKPSSGESMRLLGNVLALVMPQRSA